MIINYEDFWGFHLAVDHGDEVKRLKASPSFAHLIAHDDT